MQNCVAILQSSKNPWRDFLRRPTRDWRGGEAVAGRLKGGLFAYRKWLKHLGVSLRSKCMSPAGNGAVAEPRKARGA